MSWADEELQKLRAEFPGQDFWYVQNLRPPASWCWRPKGSDDGTRSQHRGSPQEVRAAISGTEEEIHVPQTDGGTSANRAGGPDSSPGDPHRGLSRQEERP